MRFYAFILSILFILVCSTQAARGEAAKQTEADTVTVTSDSSDYVISSLLIMQPDQSNMVSYFGHTALRLQCPSQGLDFCFTFDSFASGNYWSLLMGNERTTLLPVASEDFFHKYREDHRKVYEHRLNLTLAENRRLWQCIDRLVASGTYMPTDYVNHGCAGETASIISSVIDGKLVYPPTINCLGDTQSEIIGTYLVDDTWQQLMCYLFAAHDVHRLLANNEEKLMLPTVLEMIWNETKVVDDNDNERPLFTPGGMVVHDAPELAPVNYTMFSPECVMMALFIFVLLISFFSTFNLLPPLFVSLSDAILFLGYNALAFALTAFLLFSTQPTTCGWNCNIIPFNPLPLCVWLVWRFRGATSRTRIITYAAYSLVLAAFLVYMSVHAVFFDIPQYYMVGMLLVRTLALCFTEYKNKQTITL